MKTVNEVSKITGISVRTLHHYDAIGLLKPTAVTAAGYRLYDDNALARLSSILLFRELNFSLKDIAAILDRPDFDPIEAIDSQIEMLKLMRERLDGLIKLGQEIKKKGVFNMDFTPFDSSKIDKLQEEAKERWGNTEAWREYSKRGKKDDFAAVSKDMMAIFESIGALKHLSPEDSCVQEQIKKLKDFITANFYTCTNDILLSLGSMYVCDERFKANIDRSGGEGTAEFTNEAIKVFSR